MNTTSNDQFTIELICDTTFETGYIDFCFSRTFKYNTIKFEKGYRYIFKNQRDYMTALDMTLYTMDNKKRKWKYSHHPKL